MKIESREIKTEKFSHLHEDVRKFASLSRIERKHFIVENYPYFENFNGLDSETVYPHLYEVYLDEVRCGNMEFMKHLNLLEKECEGLIDPLEMEEAYYSGINVCYEIFAQLIFEGKSTYLKYAFALLFKQMEFSGRHEISFYSELKRINDYYLNGLEENERKERSVQVKNNTESKVIPFKIIVNIQDTKPEKEPTINEEIAHFISGLFMPKESKITRWEKVKQELEKRKK